jgi:DNA-binding SARP family transcriptional activator
MNGLRICLFGQFHAWCGEKALSGFEAHKAQELFGYLLLNRDHSIPREALACLLWGDGPPASVKKSLRQALWQLVAALEPPSELATGRVLLVEPGWIKVNPEADLWLDATVFEQAFAAVQGVPGPKLDLHGAQLLQEAERLYVGDLLEGCDQQWCLYDRERLQNMYLAMLDKLMGYSEAQHEYETGLVYGARILRSDPACERTHRRLMRLHYLAGDRTAALRQYERCVTALAEALAARPGTHTVALYVKIRDEAIDGSSSAPAGAGTTVATTAPLPTAMGHLKELQSSLADLQRQVQQAIQAVERALTDSR